MNRLQAKNVIITGAGSGIGEACAHLFAEEGAQVFLLGRTESKLAAVSDAITKNGGSAHYFAADLASEESANAAFDAALETMGSVECLINSAGVGYNWEEVSPGSMAPIAATSLKNYREVMAINLDSAVFICQRAIQHMQENGGGSIVNISSIYAIIGSPDCHTYSIAKAGVAHMTKAIGATYAKDHIRANCIAPGLIETPMVAGLMSQIEDQSIFTATIPMGRPGTPKEVAYGCLYFASDESSYTTGVHMSIDGGRAVS